MIADYFWKIIFTAFVIVGFVYWKDWRNQGKEYEAHVAVIAELLDHSANAKPFDDDEAESRTFQSIYLLHKIEEQDSGEITEYQVFSSIIT